MYNYIDIFTSQMFSLSKSYKLFYSLEFDSLSYPDLSKSLIHSYAEIDLKIVTI